MIKPKRLEIECTGYSVAADWYEGKNTKHILLSLIGWTSNRKKYNDILSSIVDNTGMSALVFDYSGHGDSPFELMETRQAQHFLEVICVFDWLKEHYPDAKISVMGTSYGGYLAARLALYRKLNKLVFRAAAMYDPVDFYSLQKDIDRDWTDSIYRKDKKALASHPLFANANFSGKALVVVHEKDEQVPRETADAFIKAFGAGEYIAKGFPHSLAEMPADKIVEYQKAISDWL